MSATYVPANGRLLPEGPAIWQAICATFLVTVGLLFPGLAMAQSKQGNGPIGSVNPLIGTGRSPIPGVIGSNENLFPGPSLPFGMVQLSPDTESNGYGYHYFQHEIQGFSMTHMSGVGCSDEGLVFFTPTTGPVQTEVAQFESPYSHSNENASAGYYRVNLSRWGVDAELTATDRTGMARFSFPAAQQANILIPISHTLNYVTGAEAKVVGDREIEGYVQDRAFCGSKQLYKVYYDMTFNRPFSSFGTWHGKSPAQPAMPVKGAREVSNDTHAQWIGAYASWNRSQQPQNVTVRIGISYVDLAGAKNNLEKESGAQSFEDIRNKAREAWKHALSAVDVTGGSASNRAIFYTALYHSLLMPSTASDADGRYMGFDHEIHKVAADHAIYADYSGWDVYRSQMPLVALIEPQRMQDIAQSIVEMEQQGGWIGRWPQVNVYTNVMAGSPLTTVMCMTWLDGLHGFDMGSAWPAMLRDATQAPPLGKPYQGEAGIKWINQIHYVPNDKVSYGSVSQLQEDTVAYASLYYLAMNMGKRAEAKTLFQRALYYRNLFDPQGKFFRPRNSDGKWVPDFNPAQNGHGFIEGSGWHYQWLVPTDMAWLIDAVGKDQFNSRLTQFFDYKKSGWYGQYYNPYNETDLEAPFEFNFSGEPWKSQEAVRRVLGDAYLDNPNGVPGNDDAGEMSSWAVMSMMGIYSVDPASLAYELVSPVFPKIVVHLQAPYSGNTLTIEASRRPESNPYIQSVTLNGKTHEQNWVNFHDLTNGGTLQFALGSKPNHSWGSAPGDAPPSMSHQKQ